MRSAAGRGCSRRVTAGPRCIPTLSGRRCCCASSRACRPPGATARFRAVVALALPGGRTFAREGVLEGRIAAAPRGDSGFGYDPVFELPDGRTAAELGEEKQRISHRALAIRAMMDVLESLREECA